MPKILRLQLPLVLLQYSLVLMVQTKVGLQSNLLPLNSWSHENIKPVNVSVQNRTMENAVAQRIYTSLIGLTTIYRKMKMLLTEGHQY